MTRVGIRELKQNASAVLRRVAGGEVVEVTDRGRPIARLVPIPREESIVDRLVAEGKATPANGDLAELPPPIRPKPGRPLPSEILAEMRADER